MAWRGRMPAMDNINPLRDAIPAGEIRRALVIKLRHHGDVLVASPVFSALKAQAPQAELFRYAIDLRSMTQGRGSFDMEFSHYEEVPNKLAETLIASTKKEEPVT